MSCVTIPYFKYEAGTRVSLIPTLLVLLQFPCLTHPDFACHVTVPMDLDVKMKAVMIGAVFLIVSTPSCFHTVVTVTLFILLKRSNVWSSSQNVIVQFLLNSLLGFIVFNLGPFIHDCHGDI